jgi:hypothetical protein
MANREKLEVIAKMLLERESLSADDINDILAGKELKPLNNDKEKKEKNGKTPAGDSQESLDENETGEEAEDANETKAG